MRDPRIVAHRVGLALVVIAALASPAAALTGKQFKQVGKILKGGQTVRVESLAVTPSGGTTAQPLGVRVPAVGAAGAPICGVIGGKFECVSVISVSCPSSIQLVQEGTNDVFDCEVECTPPTPADDDTCDCEIKYDTCTAA